MSQDLHTPDLPGEPGSWREYRAALKKLMGRAELTALAIERLSNDPAARALGAVSIADATVGRKIADREEPVDARAVRSVVVCCQLAAARRGQTLPEADIQRWLAVRTTLAERPRPDPVTPVTVAETATATGGDTRLTVSGWSPRRIWLAGVLAAVVVVAAGAALWTMNCRHPVHPGAVPAATGSAGADDLVAGQPPCRNPPDRASGTGLSITAPTPGTVLTGDSTETYGGVRLGPDERPPWIVLYAVGECRFYLEAPAMVSGDRWAGTLYYDPTQHGAFIAYALVVKTTDDQRLHEIVEASRSPYIVRLPPGARVVHVTVHCCR